MLKRLDARVRPVRDGHAQRVDLRARKRLRTSDKCYTTLEKSIAQVTDQRDQVVDDVRGAPRGCEGRTTDRPHAASRCSIAPRASWTRRGLSAGTRNREAVRLEGSSSRQRAGLEPFNRQAPRSALQCSAQDRDRRPSPCKLHLVFAPLVQRQLDACDGLAGEAPRRSGAVPSSGSMPAASCASAASSRLALRRRPRRPSRRRSADARAGAGARRRSVRSSAPVVSASSRPTGTIRSGIVARRAGRPCGRALRVAGRRHGARRLVAGGRR